MLSVSDAAEKLGVSQARVRALLKSGILEGAKLGRAWIVSEQSVQQRLRKGVHAGRPALASSAFERAVPDIESAHRIYDEAVRVLSGCYDGAFLSQARTPEEQAFWIKIADFFLQQKQRELIDEGIF